MLQESWFWLTLKGHQQMIAWNAVCHPPSFHLLQTFKSCFYPEMTDALMCDCNSDTRLGSTRPAEFLLIARGQFVRVHASACAQDVCTALTFDGDDLHPLRPSYLGDRHTKSPRNTSTAAQEAEADSSGGTSVNSRVGGETAQFVQQENRLLIKLV